MRRLSLVFGCLLLTPLAARAQFYDIDGAYRCVTAPAERCAERLSERPPPPPPSKEAVAAAAASGIAEVIARVRRGQATAADFAALEARAAARDPRAVEVLAWCKLGGIGMPADPLGAYWLYRTAADMGVANARENQVAVFETRLNSEQRQQVLVRENDPDR